MCIPLYPYRSISTFIAPRSAARDGAVSPSPSGNRAVIIFRISRISSCSINGSAASNLPHRETHQR